MRLASLAALTITALAIMIGIDSLSNHEILAVEDGKPSASQLPLDRESSRVASETATFGLG